MNAIQVCPDRDIECGTNADNWCMSCPKRKQAADTMAFAASYAMSQREDRTQKFEISAQTPMGFMATTVVNGREIPKALANAMLNGTPLPIEPTISGDKIVGWSLVDGAGFASISPRGLDPRVLERMRAQAFTDIAKVMASPAHDGILARIREIIAQVEKEQK